MSGPLVPSNAQFAQQGSVDWVALSNTSVHFSVAVLSRLSRAGIDAFTLQVGRAICFNFPLEPNGQERVSEAILKLKRYGSYGNLIWFGFGIREIITDLADTEEGLTLVALCAALSTTYDTLFTAKVLRELCVLCKAPQSFTPALRQWKALVELCAGILTSAHFVVLLNGFRRLISSSSPYTVENRYTPTTPSALAAAILTLARISKHNLVNAVFCGGLDCAWLAAFAEWILSLDVGICESSSSFLYRSRDRVESLPSVTILLYDTIGSGLLRTTTSIVPNGQSLLQKDPALHGISLLNWQGSWSTILHDVFHRNIDALLADNTGLYFAMLLKCISTLQKRDKRDYGGDQSSSLDTSWANHPVNPLLRFHYNGGGQGYIDFATRRLPELCASLSASPPLPQAAVADLGRCALQTIENACSGAFHGGKTGILNGDDNHVCLRTMAEVIVIYLWILLDADLDDDVLPSITGLANLYSWQSRANKAPGPANGPWYQSMMSCDYPALGIDLVFNVLSGVSVLGSPPKMDGLPTIECLARVGNGICVYYHAVEDPTLPPESIFRIRVVRGYITHSDFRFQELCGMKNANSADSLHFDHFQGKPTIRSVQTLIQETDEKRLEMAYLLHYLAKEGRHSTQWLHLPFLFRKLQRRARTSSCLNDCKALYKCGTFRRGPIHPPRWAYSRRGYHDDSYDSPVTRKISRECVDKAQRFMATLGGIPDTWILLGENGVYSIILGYPLLLYAMIGRSSRCLSPFTECFDCIISMGLEFGLSQASELLTTDDEGRNKRYIYLSLLASNQTDAVLMWEIENWIPL